jgi:hypothetical protein
MTLVALSKSFRAHNELFYKVDLPCFVPLFQVVMHRTEALLIP